MGMARMQGVREAPTFHPTEAEFADPLTYINSIRPEAEKCARALQSTLQATSWLCRQLLASCLLPAGRDEVVSTVRWPQLMAARSCAPGGTLSPEIAKVPFVAWPTLLPSQC